MIPKSGYRFSEKDHAPTKKERIMLHDNIGEQIRAQAAEPLLPIEKKLIGWSLGIGIVLLIVLTAISRLF
jgi:hypothetical protein